MTPVLFSALRKMLQRFAVSMYFFLDQQNLLFKKKTVMDCPKRVLNLLKLNTEQPTAHAVLLPARGKNGRHGPLPAEWEHAHVILKVL